VVEAAGITLAKRQRDRRKTSFYDDELGMRVMRSVMTPEEGAIVEHGLRSMVDEFVRLTRGDKADKAVSSLDPTHQLLTDALVETMKRSQAGSSGRSLPHVIVHVDALTLQTGMRHDGTVLRLDDGTPIGLDAVQEMLCDATVTGVLFADLATVAKGRTIRTANDDHWDILRARDKGCVFPDCPMPADYCQAHHIRHWTAHHGPTEPENLVLLCSGHHHLVHDGGWTMKGPAHALQIIAAIGQVFWTRKSAGPPSPPSASGQPARPVPDGPPVPSRRNRLRRRDAPPLRRSPASAAKPAPPRPDVGEGEGSAVVRRAIALAERARRAQGSGEGARGGQLRDLGLAVAEVVAEDLGGVLADGRAGVGGTVRGVREGGDGTVVRERSDAGMVELDEEPAVRELRVGVQVRSP
jgi:hypothetical protein